MCEMSQAQAGRHISLLKKLLPKRSVGSHLSLPLPFFLFHSLSFSFLTLSSSLPFPKKPEI
jgi:hypothetical protein